MLFCDYTSKVVEEYHNKVASNTISPRLARPTTAKLREECEAVFAEGLLPKDENTLKIFFELKGDKSSFRQSIRMCDIDKFRPLINFINGKTKTTEDRNIELLAWLIDFKERPFNVGKTRIENTGEKRDPNLGDLNAGIKERVANNKLISNSDERQEVANQPLSQTGKRTLSKRELIILVVVILMLGVAGDIWLNSKKTVFGATRHGECMYWAGDHYERAFCDKKMDEGVILVALDSMKMQNFKKITRTDTITQNSVGKVWYYKRNGKLEYYTRSGNHPIYMQETLKPITPYIINTYLLKANQ